MVNVRNSNVDSILFIRSAEREHSGSYELVLQIENLEDRATVNIRVIGKVATNQVAHLSENLLRTNVSTVVEGRTKRCLIQTDKPGPPMNVKVADVWGFNAALEWDPPKDDGNSEITGYTIQKADMKTKVNEEEKVHSVQINMPKSHLVLWDYSKPRILGLLQTFKDLGILSPFFHPLQEWFTVYEHNRRTNCTVSDLVMGNEYMFRIYSENLCGLSEEPRASKNTAVIAKIGTQMCARTADQQVYSV